VVLLRVFDLLSLTLTLLVVGVFWGPWLALTRSMSSFAPEVFVPLVHRLDTNLGRIMGILFPIAILSFVPVLVLTFGNAVSFALTTVALALLVLALVVTAAVEVPIVKRIRGWTPATLPPDWQRLRDRWVSFHVLRVVPGIVGFVLLAAGALWQS
jgi:Domain of unknown function (DUF1772)